MLESQPRRKFLRGLARGAGLTALGGLVGALGVRWARRKGGVCPESARLWCRRCPVLRSCSRPAAARAREAKRRAPSGRNASQRKG